RAQARCGRIHVVVAARRRARERCRLAHRLSVRNSIAARETETLRDPSATAIFRSCAICRGLRGMSAAMGDNKPAKPSVWRAFTQPSAWTMFFFGFASGLPFLLVGGTLAYWLKESGIELKSIT